MRKLTITRRKSFVASLAKMKVYLEDRQYGDTMISGTPCRLLGTIKNGETVTFDIPTTAGMLFVTAGKNSYCSEALPIFEGEADIFLSGQNYYDRISGNAFRFDGVNNEITMAHRYESARKGRKVQIISAVVGVIIGIAIILIGTLIPASPKTFSEKNITITLTDEFEIDYNQDHLVSFVSYTHGVLVDRATLSEIALVNESIHSLEEFARYIESVDNDIYVTTKSVTKEGNLLYFEYEETTEGVTYHSAVYFFETDTHYWFVEIFAEKDDFEASREEVAAWAESISVR